MLDHVPDPDPQQSFFNALLLNAIFEVHCSFIIHHESGKLLVIIENK